MMVDMNIFDQQFWKDAWDNDPNTQDKRMKRAGLGNPDAPGFEKWAENFNKIRLQKKVRNAQSVLCHGLRTKRAHLKT